MHSADRPGPYRTNLRVAADIITSNVQSREANFVPYTDLASSYTGELHYSYEL